MKCDKPVQDKQDWLTQMIDQRRNIFKMSKMDTFGPEAGTHCTEKTQQDISNKEKA